MRRHLAWVLASALAGLGTLPAARALEIGGRVQAEAAALRGQFTDDARSRSGRYVRRAELELRATLAPPLEATATVVLDDEDRAALDELMVTAWPVGRRGEGLSLRLGRFDPDFGLDPSTSSNWSLLLERSPVFDLAPDVASGDDSLGVRADHAGQRHAVSASLMFGEARDQAVLRTVALDGTAARVWQLGASVALGRGLADDGRFRSRLGLRATTELDGGRRATLQRALRAGEVYRRDTTLGLEAAWQQGRLLLQAEWLQRRLGAASAGSPSRQARGHTVTAAWVLQGAARRHDARRARFGRPGSGGSLEAQLRVDRLHAGDGRARAMALGLAWTVDRVWRVAANHVWARSDGPAATDSGQGWALRVQASF